VVLPHVAAFGVPSPVTQPIDTVREVHVPPAWTGVGAFLAEMPGWFRLDRTEGQEHALYVAA
jgi:hypothetical protein